MITCNHVSAHGQFDSDASVLVGAVNSERLSEGELFHCITLCSCTGVTLQMMSALMCYFCFMHIHNIMHVCSDPISHLNVFS